MASLTRGGCGDEANSQDGRANSRDHRQMYKKGVSPVTFEDRIKNAKQRQRDIRHKLLAKARSLMLMQRRNSDKVESSMHVETDNDARLFPRRSQYGRILLLGDSKLWNSDEGFVRFIGFKSGLIKRTCRSTFRAETHGMIYAKEASDGVRAMITDMHGELQMIDWESVCAKEVHNVWMTDCQSQHVFSAEPRSPG